MRHAIGMVLGAWGFAAVCAGPGAAGAAHADPGTTADPRGIEFFEASVRPLLARHCHECHSQDAEELRGGLLLDSRPGWQRGGEGGAVIEPGDVEASRLIHAVRYDDADLQMPPDGKLSDTEIAALVEWVELGAPDPRDGEPPTASQAPPERGRDFWSFQPPRDLPPPPVEHADWPATEIDRFILARLEAEDLAPAPEADRRTLIRRLYFDLIGLPPAPEQVGAFLEDDSGDALEKLVDALLASPHFGERWGRHWLDVARYAESAGERGRIFPNAWRYRDYVIDSFNRDKPYDRFIVEQIAGDLLDHEAWQRRREAITATGFLAMGPHNFELQDKQQLRWNAIDEQLDTIGRSMLGMTIGCARCHDHPFDPMPETDYYGMAAILRGTRTLVDANVSDWIERSLPVSPERERELARYAAALEPVEAKLEAAREALMKLTGEQRTGGHEASEFPGVIVDDTDAERIGDWRESTHSGNWIGAGYIHDDDAGKGEKSVTYTPDLPEAGLYEVRISYSWGDGREPRVPITVRGADGEHALRFSQRPEPSVDRMFEPIGRFRFDAGTSGSVVISNENTTTHVIADAVQFIPVDEETGLAVDQIESEEAGEPGEPEQAERAAAIADAEANAGRLEAELAAIEAGAPASRPHAMAVREHDPDQIGDHYVLRRGMARDHGEPAPRTFLSAAMQGDPPAFPDDQSGRLELARWIADPDNPLTARVMVNRIWHHLFGAGLVRTTDNFGAMGARPSHPDLLDHLASRFVADDWSIKQTIRRIVLSRTYRMSTEMNDRAMAVDPDNRLLWRANRRRLQAEPIRDAMLSVSGRLDPEAGGPTIRGNPATDFGYEFAALRRSVYLPVFRNALPDLFEAFDFANPNLVVARRTVSTLPTQALLLTNSPFVMEQAEHAARSLLAEPDLDDAARVDLAYRRALSRPPTDAERDLALNYLRDQLGHSTDAAEQPVGQPVSQASAPASDTVRRRLHAWADLMQAIFASVDFRYLN